MKEDNLQPSGRILKLRQILKRKTDEKHKLTGPALIQKITEAGYHISDETLRKDLKALSQNGFPYVSSIGGKDPGYFSECEPFSQPELLAKVKSLLRRYQQYRGKPASSIWTCGNLEVDLGTRMVRSAGETVPLTDTEYSILECLVKNRGRTVTTQELYESVWNEKFLPGSGNTIMVHVLNLRRKIEEVPSSPKIIRTVWGRGYQVD